MLTYQKQVSALKGVAQELEKKQKEISDELKKMKEERKQMQELLDKQGIQLTNLQLIVDRLTIREFLNSCREKVANNLHLRSDLFLF